MEPMETAVERLQKELDRLVPRNSNSQTFTLQTSSPVAWICVLVAVVSVMFAFFSLQMASDARSQGRADRQELLDEIRALKDDTKGIRAYIITGRLQPLPERKPDAE